MVRFACLVCVGLIFSEFALPQGSRQVSGVQALELRIQPEYLAPLVLDQSIRAVIRDGTYFEGRVVKASPEGLTVRVGRTEPRGRLARPEAVIRAADISVVRMRKNGSPAAAITLGIIGGISGFVLGASCCEESLPLPLVLGSTASVAGAVGGSVLGKELNRKTLTILVIDPGQRSTRFGDDQQEAAGRTEE
jgi:hypothetical protein